MKIHCTKHCLKRREHYEQEDPELVKSVFAELLKDKALENGLYKMSYKYFCCIFRKKKDTYTVVTIRGHKKLFEKNHLDKPKIRLANTAFHSTGGFIIRRKNFFGKTVKCGYIIDVSGTDYRLLVLYKDVPHKFDLSAVKHVPKVGLKFKDDSEILELVNFNEIEQCWYLNNFERIN